MNGRNRPAVVAMTLLALGTVALLVRFHGLGEARVVFHPTRHYRSAVIARALFYDADPTIPEWARRIAHENRAMQPTGEPPILEWLAARAYRALGREDMRIPRGVTAMSWVLGVIPLFFIARRLGDDRLAFIGSALYLFIPYAIVGSRTFQPDALMTTSALLAILAAIRYYERPGAGQIIAAGVLAGTSMLIKPMSVFLVLPAILGLAASARPWKRMAFQGDFWLLMGLSLAPPAAFYGYDALFGNLVRDQFGMRFVPSLLPTAFFWRGLAGKIGVVHSWPLFLLGLAGAVVATPRMMRRLLIALFLGYVAFAIAFTYHMPTHDYYHLPYVALTALGATAMLERLFRVLAPRMSPRVLSGVVTAAVLAIMTWGSAKAWPQLTVKNGAQVIANYERIGTLTKHDPHVLFLDLEYGYSLMYHGQLSGDSWPNVDDLAAEQMGGLEPISAEERFERDYADFYPSYFVVTDMRSLNEEPGLRPFLEKRTTLVEQTPDYAVFQFKS